MLDAGHIGWAVRLSERHPTLEIRVADTQLTAGISVAIAVLLRAIIDTGLAGDPDPAAVDDSLLDLGLWHASKMGPRGPHYDASTGQGLPPSGCWMDCWNSLAISWPSMVTSTVSKAISTG